MNTSEEKAETLSYKYIGARMSGSSGGEVVKTISEINRHEVLS